jgi:hypothetical protein
MILICNKLKKGPKHIVLALFGFIKLNADGFYKSYASPAHAAP